MDKNILLVAMIVVVAALVTISLVIATHPPQSIQSAEIPQCYWCGTYGPLVDQSIYTDREVWDTKCCVGCRDTLLQKDCRWYSWVYNKKLYAIYVIQEHSAWIIDPRVDGKPYFVEVDLKKPDAPIDYDRYKRIWGTSALSRGKSGK